MLLFAALALFATELSAELSAESAAAELSAEGRKRLAPWGATRGLAGGSARRAPKLLILSTPKIQKFKNLELSKIQKFKNL